MNRYFGTDGIREKVNEKIDCNFMINLALAIKVGLFENKDRPKIVLGLDPRNSSIMLAYSLMAGFGQNGIDVDYIGVVTTPMVSFITQSGYDLGVMISASHNPYYYNGVKIFNHLGEKISKEDEMKIENNLIEGKESCTKVENLGKIIHRYDLPNQYFSYLKSLYNPSDKVYKIGFDCAFGSAANVVQRVYEGLGIDFILINNNPDGLNINDKCGATNLEGLIELVKRENLDIGFAFDGDGDRLMVVANSGEVIDGDYLLGLFSYYYKAKRLLENDKVVGTIITNIGLKKYLNSLNIELLESFVGDKEVYNLMKKECANLGSEQSGHVICRDYLNTGDGILSSIMFINALNHLKINCCDVVKMWKKYPQISKDITIDEAIKNDLLEEENFKKIISQHQKKLPVDSKLVIRASGTEAKIRIMVEAKDIKKGQEVVKNLIESVEKYINNRKKSLS